MAEGDRQDTTQLLLDARGDRHALDLLIPVVYDELRAIAHQHFRRNRAGETLNTTALVHETYLRLVDQSRVEWRDRAHFLAIASRAMRYVLVDHVRARRAQKRGGGQDPVTFDSVQVHEENRAIDLLDLDRALDALSEYSERLVRVVECRFFGGLSFEELGEALGCSTRTAKRDWVRARTWLFEAMQPGEG